MKSYQEAPALEEALAIMVTGYKQLGLDSLSQDARRVLQKNFPQSIYLSKPYDPALRGGVESKSPSVWSKLKFW